jgi:chemotaxis protein CheX
MDVMPQMGFPMPKRLRVYLQDRNVISNGVTLTVGFTRQMHGKVVYNMTTDTARYIASTMMFGIPVDKFNEMAQSALREMSNMLTAHAAMGYSKMGVDVDITTPELNIEEDYAIKISDAHYLTVEMDVGGNRIDIALAVDRDV